MQTNTSLTRHHRRTGITRTYGITAVLLIFYALHLLYAPRASAQQSGLSISPALFELVINPGESKTTTIAVKNTTGMPINVQASARPIALPAGLSPSEGSSQHLYDATSWIQFDAQEFTLKANELKNVRVTVTSSSQDTPGGHYATIVFTPKQSPLAPQQHSALITAEVGSTAFITLKGDLEEAATVTPQGSTNRFDSFGPLRAEYNLINTGNTHTAWHGEFIVTDLRGKQVARQKVDSRLSLPGTTTKVSLRWGSRLMLNRYRIKPEIYFGSSTKPLEAASMTVWVIPVLPAGAGLITMLAIVIFMRYTHGRWNAAWTALKTGSLPKKRFKNLRRTDRGIDRPE